jgi:single-strand DNA-binding protein
MNVVALIGNVASDPELRYTASGRAVCTFRMAVSRPGGEQADFFTIVAWERQAEVCGEYITTGRRVGVEGRLHYSTWSTDDGAKRSKIEIVATRVQLLGPRPATADAEEQPAGVADAGNSTPDPQTPPESVPAEPVESGTRTGSKSRKPALV